MKNEIRNQKIIEYVKTHSQKETVENIIYLIVIVMQFLLEKGSNQFCSIL